MTAYRDLDTPALLVDMHRVEANIARMASISVQNAVTLRPHTKTHKSPDIAKMQIRGGASGITCAKLGEAEVMAEAGLNDILIANEIIGEQKLRRLLKLARRTRLCIAVDSDYGARQLNEILDEAEQTLDVVIEINCGQNRSGVLPGTETLNFARRLLQMRNIHLRGLMTHGGQSYNEKNLEGIKSVGLHEGRVMVETAELLRKNGIPAECISVGSTPTAEYCCQPEGVTEIRPGTYVFGDLTQVNLFACTMEDCALTVLATVTSHPSESRVIIDAGKKSLTSDLAVRTRGSEKAFGWILEKNCHINRLSEEHGIIETHSEFTIGEKIRIVPNHVCVVVNLFDEMYGVRDGKVEHVFPIAARGKLT